MLARVIGLFSGRGYNIESLTVAETDHESHLSRITIVTTGTPMVIEQIKSQLERLVPVHQVVDLTVEGPAIERELALVKVRGNGEQRVEALRLADVFRARVIDATTESFVFEITGATDKIDALHRPDASRSAWSRSRAPASWRSRAGPRGCDLERQLRSSLRGAKATKQSRCGAAVLDCFANDGPPLHPSYGYSSLIFFADCRCCAHPSVISRP